MTALQPHQQRVVNERNELADQLFKLRVFTESRAFFALPTAEQDALARQEQAMSDYLGALTDRMRLWGMTA